MKVRKISMANKIFLIVMALLVVTDVSLGWFVFNKTYTQKLNEIRGNAENIARCAAASVDGELFEQVHSLDDMEGEAFQTIHDSLSVFFENGGVEYCYTVRQTSDGFEFVVDSDPEAPGLPGDEYDADVADTTRAMAGETLANQEPYQDEWGSHISAYSPIYLDGGVVGLAAVDVNADVIMEETGKLTIEVILICGIFLIVGVVLMFIISRYLRRGFVTLNDEVMDLANGDGDLTRRIEISSGDEFEVIAENVNRLVSYIREIMLNISRNSGLLQTSAVSIAKNMGEAGESAAAVGSTMEDMSATMEETSASLHQIDGLMNDIAASFESVMGQIGEGREFSGNIRQHAIEVGNRAQSDKDDASEKVAEMATSVQEKIERSKAVEQIDVLTENILNITQQTNLLSLNASIEAARAGEAGRGFAVVADEIGHLAQDSASAAAEIQNVSSMVIQAVNELADEARNMIDFINGPALHGYEELVETSSNYRESAEKFDEIIAEFADLSQNIQTNIQVIGDATNELSDSMEQSATNIVSITEQTLNMSNNMNSIDQDANSSRDISDALSEEVGKFKLE